MRILRQSSESSFYESFSDLLFGTLVLFVVLVMGMALEMRSPGEPKPDATPKAQTPKDPGAGSRFVGGAGATTCYVGYLPGKIDGRTVDFLVWVPQSVAHEWDLAFASQKINAMGRWCSFAQKDGLALMPVTDLMKMEKALGLALIQGMQTRIEYGYKAYLMRALQARLSTFKSIAPMQLGELLGGADTSESERIAVEVQDADQQFLRWAFGANRTADWRRPIHEGDGRLLKSMERAGRKPEEGAFVRFHAPSTRGNLAVGDAVITPETFRGILRSIAPGGDFFVQHMDERFDKPAPAPDWVIQDVLGPVGFRYRAK